MSAYDVTISGCDDSTKLFDLDMTDAEVATVRRIAELTKQQGGGCKPTVASIEPAPERPADADCHACWEPIPADAPRCRDSWGDWIHGDCETAS